MDSSTPGRNSANLAFAAQQTQRRSRRKSERDRIRVTRACDQCKRQKIRCTGALPCEICVRKGSRCSYNASYARGRAPSIVLNEPAVQGTVSRDNSLAKERTREPSSRPGSMLGQESSQGSPEPSQTDSQGHYVGPASGVSFLLRVQRRVHETLRLPQTSSTFTFGDVPMPDFDVSFFVLPPKDDARSLLERYFDFAVPTHRYLHRPTIEAWLEELYLTFGCMRNKDEAPAKVALLLMVFAQASLYMPLEDANEATTSDVSARYFRAAEQQLQKERGQIRLASVQARLAQCFFLLSQSRVNHCWSLFGTTANLALAIGLNRNRKTAQAGLAGRVETECRQRVFWCAYTLDKYLAAALGRPRTFREEDIDQDMPSCIDDSELGLDEVQSHPSRSQPLMLAAIAHVKLARIIDEVLRDLYPIQPLSMSSRMRITARCSKKLHQWHEELTHFLESSIINTSLLLPIYQRQRNVLNFAYWHATILTHRPFLLSKLGRVPTKGDARSRSGITTVDDQAEESLRECLQAALKICDLFDELVNANTMFKAFFFTSYYAFCAVVVLYVYTMQQNTPSPEINQIYLSTALRCQTQMSRIADGQSLARRYCLVLDELRKEAARPPETSPRENTYTVANNGISTQQHSVQHQGESMGTLAGPSALMGMTGPPGLDTSPGSSLCDTSGWGTFDSMVLSGFGNLDDLIGDGTFNF